MSDRYSSVDGEPIEHDSVRVPCLLLVSRYVRENSGSMPISTREQLQAMRSLIHKKLKCGVRPLETWGKREHAPTEKHHP